MNAQLKELELQAAYGIIDPNGPFTADEFINFNKKFAELIIKECIDIALTAAKDTNYTHSAVTASDMRALGIAAQIKLHFGVE